MRLLSFLILIISSSNLMAQTALWGVVTNENNERLEGASVFLVGTDYATISDYEGYYTLDSLKAGSYDLKVTYLGYDAVTKTVSITEDTEMNVVMVGSIFQLDDIEITANKLDEQSPFTFTDQNKEEIGTKNLAQDLPFLVEHTPSMVVTSDAGAGVGYTGMRIRGSDATRINVTINGVPLNDSESHGVFWVNLPDLASSADKIQIQRGVGPSTNGTGAFGGTVGINTNQINQNPFIRLQGSYGSFNTRKVSATFSTGLMNQKYLLEGRYSTIDSDGYIDRATSDLSSYFFSGAKVTPNSSLRLNIFGGKEVTYQAWNGVPHERLHGTDEELLEHYNNNSNGNYNTQADSTNLFDSGRTYNAYLYENEVDDYGQTHIQLIYNKQVSETLKLNATGYFTHGEGFFEQFKHQENLADWPIPRTDTADLVVQRWLDNNFYGVILNGEGQASDALKVNVGLSYNTYKGDHFGDVVRVLTTPILAVPTQYYSSDATKTDLSAFLKAEYQISERFSAFGDLQVRNLTYQTAGVDNDSTSFSIDTSYNFLNPKLGLSYKMDNGLVYASVAVGNREPVRSDFLDAIGTEIPTSEKLIDYELGYKRQGNKFSLEANAFFMDYTDQLVLTGAVNDVGGAVRVNVPDSYRAGIELALSYGFSDYLVWSPNLSFSQSRISKFTYEVTGEELENTDISFSPSVVVGSRLAFSPLHNMELTLLSKYVSKQYMDNTSSESKSLPAYLVNDLVVSHKLNLDLVEEIEFKLVVNNILNATYSSNAYTYSYIYGGQITERYLYPQAGLNFLLGASVTF